MRTPGFNAENSLINIANQKNEAHQNQVITSEIVVPYYWIPPPAICSPECTNITPPDPNIGGSAVCNAHSSVYYKWTYCSTTPKSYTYYDKVLKKYCFQGERCTIYLGGSGSFSGGMAHP
jgi:hypothetical protein